jgi:hypothetical protein
MRIRPVFVTDRPESLDSKAAARILMAWQLKSLYRRWTRWERRYTRSG